MNSNPHIDIVFDGPVGPDGPRLIEIDDAKGVSVPCGTWIELPDGTWVLRLTAEDVAGARPYPAP